MGPLVNSCLEWMRHPKRFIIPLFEFVLQYHKMSTIYSDFEAMCEEYGATVREHAWGSSYSILKKEHVDDGSGVNVTVREGPGKAGVCTYLVDHDQVREPRVRDSFEEVKLGPDKIECNRLFAEYAGKSPASCVLALDTALGLTSAMLAVRGFEKDQVVVPNPDEREAPPEHLCTFFPCTVFELLRDYMYPQLEDHAGEYSAFLDYCCTWRGAKTGTRPKLDLNLLFACGILPKRGGIVAMSLSTRGHVGTRDHHTRIVDQEARQIARSKGYNLCLKHTCKSSSHRVQFFLWETREPRTWPSRIWVNAGLAQGRNGPWLRGTVTECEEAWVTVKDMLGYTHRGAEWDSRFLCTEKTCPIPIRMNNVLKETHFYDQPQDLEESE